MVCDDQNRRLCALIYVVWSYYGEDHFSHRLVWKRLICGAFVGRIGGCLFPKGQVLFFAGFQIAVSMS